MMPLSRPARVLVSIAAVALVAMVLLYAFPASDRRTLTIISDLCWTWAAGFAAFACFASARRLTTSEQRRAWQWISAGCASFFAGQLAWNSYDLVRGGAPYPSVADVGFLGLYACLFVGLTTLMRGQPARRSDPELILDTVLVTFTVGALAYEYLLEPLLAGGAQVPAAALVTSIAWSISAIAVLWMILMQMLRRPVFPAATAALVLPAAILFVIGDQVYAVVALRGTYHAGGPLDLTWDVGLLLIAAAAAVAPDYAQHLQRSRQTTGESTAARFIALVIGLAAITGMAIDAVLHPPERDAAVIIGIGMAIIAARVLYSLGVTRRYAHVLEDEVANQTRSLMSSLGAPSSTPPRATCGRAAASARRWDGSTDRERASRERISPRHSMASCGVSRCRFGGPTAPRAPARSCSRRCAKAAGSPKFWSSSATSRSSAARKRSCSRPRSSPPWASW